MIGEGVAQGLRRLFDGRGLGARRFVVSNPLVWRLHGDTVQRALPGAVTILVPDGDAYRLYSMHRAVTLYLPKGK